jgi:uncharacterized membrane protein YbhN (UPF0104 family)
MPQSAVLDRPWARKTIALARSPAAKVVFAAAVFVLAGWAIRRDFRGVTFAQVTAAFAATPVLAVVVAAAAIAASFACLGVTEWFALRYVGKPLAVGRAMAVAFVCYAFANTIGFGPATVSAVRLRFYRKDGLNAKRIAAVTVLAAAAVTLSGAVCAGVGLLMPGPVPMRLRILGVVLLAPVALWLSDFGKGVRIGGVRLRAPGSLKERLGFLAAGIGDWILSGGALFLLLPGAPVSQFPAFLAVFVAGCVVGSASGVPGGLGVFEAVVLGLRGATAQVHQTAAALIIYRLLNAVGPLAIAGAGIGLSRLRARR